jgi:lipoyl-dependent peroxiredoxin
MPVRRANAEWKGGLPGGTGEVSTESKVLRSPYSFAGRFENGDGTNPEELIAAAHAACYSMAFSAGLAKAGHTPRSVKTEAAVQLDKVDGGFAVTGIHLRCEADVPDIDEDTFQKIAQEAKEGCPISRLLAAVDIRLDAGLV